MTSHTTIVPVDPATRGNLGLACVARTRWPIRPGAVAMQRPFRWPRVPLASALVIASLLALGAGRWFIWGGGTAAVADDAPKDTAAPDAAKDAAAPRSAPLPDDHWPLFRGDTLARGVS